MNTALKYSKAGFTVVELLVVTAIISILTAFLMPALRGARERGKAVQCMSNLRQIGIGLNMYLGERDEKFPACVDYLPWRTPDVIGESKEEIQFVLGAYLGPNSTAGMRSEVWVCPSGKRFGRYHDQPDPVYNLGRFGWPASWGPKPAYNITYRYNSKPTRHKDSMAASPLANNCEPQFANRLTSRSQAAIMWDLPDGLDSISAPPGLGTPALHGSGINCLFVDGHVAHVKVAYDGGGNGLATPETLWWFAGEYKDQGWDGAKVPGTDQP
jgi:prepilin-type processing-associated H-X9-DG protein/prepilin-type N-terminal cleavage/methylation domain-containing protein